MATFTGIILIDLLGVITALVAVIVAYYKWAHSYWKRRNVPYLEPSIPFGNSANPLNMKQSTGEWMRKMYNKVKAKGLVSLK